MLVSRCLYNPWFLNSFLLVPIIPFGVLATNTHFAPSGPWVLPFTFLARSQVPQITWQFLERRVGLQLSLCFLQAERIEIAQGEADSSEGCQLKLRDPISASSHCHSRQLLPNSSSHAPWLDWGWALPLLLPSIMWCLFLENWAKLCLRECQVWYNESLLS